MIPPERAKISSANILLDETVELQPNREYFLRGVCHNQDKAADWLFIPNNSNLSTRDVFAAHCIVNIEKTYVPIRIITGSDAHTLYSGTHLGCIEPLSEQHSRVQHLRMVLNNPKLLQKPTFDHLHGEDKEALDLIVNEFSDVFSATKMDLGCSNVVKHKIDSGNAEPIAMTPRRIPMALEDKVECLLDDLLAQNIIRESHSPWCAPIVVVAKKNGDIRMCVDYRRLNSITRRPIFPIPEAKQLFDSLNGAKYFTTLDFSQGYYQVPVEENGFCNI